MTLDKRPARSIMAVLIIGLSACDSNTTPSPAIQAYAADTVPASPALAAIYQRSCQACHARGTSDAPLTGHGAAWQQRLDKGMDTLVNNVVAGVGGMPPYGLCMDCNTEEFRQLIRFMAIPADAGE